MSNKKPAIMLKTNLISFRIWKQNRIIFIRLSLRAIFINHIFRLFTDRWKFCDDVIIFWMTSSTLFFFLEVGFMIENICTNFYDYITYRSEVIERGCLHPPPWGYTSQKSLGLIGLKDMYDFFCSPLFLYVLRKINQYALHTSHFLLPW